MPIGEIRVIFSFCFGFSHNNISQRHQYGNLAEIGY